MMLWNWEITSKLLTLTKLFNSSKGPSHCFTCIASFILHNNSQIDVSSHFPLQDLENAIFIISWTPHNPFLGQKPKFIWHQCLQSYQITVLSVRTNLLISQTLTFDICSQSHFLSESHTFSWWCSPCSLHRPSPSDGWRLCKRKVLPPFTLGKAATLFPWIRHLSIYVL